MRILLGHPKAYASGDIANNYERALKSVGHEISLVANGDLKKLSHRSTSSIKPDLFLSIHGGKADTESVANLSSSGIKTAVVLLDDPYEVTFSSSYTKFYDFVFTNDEATVSVHQRASTIPLAYDATIHYGDPASDRDIDISFVGAAFRHRKSFLASIRNDLKKYRSVFIGAGWSGWGALPHKHAVDYLSVADIYRRSKVVLNVFRDPVYSCRGNANPKRIQPTHMNPRCYEATACGAFVLSDSRKELEEKFTAEFCFKTQGDLLDKLHFLMRSPQDRINEVRKRQKKIEQDTYQARVQQILGHVFHKGST